MKRRQFIVAGGAAAAAAVAKPGWAQAPSQAWPAGKPITVVCPVAPGGSADQVARALAGLMQRKLPGATVVVRNTVGGGGVTGFAEVAASPADGYTVGLVNVGSLLILPHTQKMPFDFNSFVFLGALGLSFNGLGVGDKSPFKSVKDVVEAGKQKTLTFATATPLQGVCMFQLAAETGMKVRMVLTATQQEAVSQAVGGHVDFCIQSSPEMIPLIEGKEMRLLASVVTKRWPNYPEVPTLLDLGYKAANVIVQGFACPAGTPQAIVSRLEEIVSNAGADPEVLQTLTKYQIGSTKMSGAEFLAVMKEQAPIVEKVLIDAGMKKI